MKPSHKLPWEFHGETFAVETPEQTRVEFRVADFGTRVVACLIDQLLLKLIWVACVLAGLLVVSAGAFEVGGYAIAVLIGALFLVDTLYFTWFELLREGQTPGKRRLKIRVIHQSGRGITFGPALIRNLARFVDSIPVLWLVPALVSGRRRLGDLLAGTIVVSEERSSAAKQRARKPVVNLVRNTREELGERTFFFSTAVAGKLHREDLNLLEFLETRLKDSPARRRPALMLEVAERYVARLGLEEDRARIVADPLRFLQELGWFLRERFEEQVY